MEHVKISKRYSLNQMWLKFFKRSTNKGEGFSLANTYLAIFTTSASTTGRTLSLSHHKLVLRTCLKIKGKALSCCLIDQKMIGGL
jgi:hypothetical protein